MDAIAVVRAWFDAFERADVDGARALFAADGLVHAGEATFVGVEATRQWFAQKARGHGRDFSYELLELLPGAPDSVAAVIELRDAHGRWFQVAVYRVAAGAIAEIRLYERGHAPSAA